MRKMRKRNGFTPLLICIMIKQAKRKYKQFCRQILNSPAIRKLVSGFSLVEMMIAFAIIVIIFAAIVPQFRAIRNSWTGNEAKAGIIQNGRILVEHITRSLAAARQIISFTSSSITFKDNNDIQKRYMLSGGYVVFGNYGSEQQLAGPVSSFRVNCYLIDPCVATTTDCNKIRLVQIDTNFPNNAAVGTKTFTASAYLRTNANTGSGLVGWWKLDETSGTTAVDSSGSGNNGMLVNMSSPGCWTTGQIGNGLDFDGYNDYASLPIGSVINSLTNCTITSWVNWSGSSSWQRIWDFGTGTTRYMFLTPRNGNNGRLRFAITTSGSGGEQQTTGPAILPSGWHHVAVTIDASNNTHKIYVDGSYAAQNTSGTLTPSSLGTTTQNYLGRSQYADPYFNGSLDDVRIYNRVLTAAEILQMATTLIYQTFDEGKASSDSASVVVTKPTGTSSGDLLIAAVATDGSTTISPPSGWTAINQGNSSGLVTLGAWYKVAGGSEPATYTFTYTGSEQAYGWISRFTGQDATNPINGTPIAANQTSATPTSPAVTTTVGNCLILRLGAFDNDDITEDAPGLSGHTAITMDKSSSGPAGLAAYWNLDETSGTTAADSSGGGRNGTLYYMSSPSCWVAGRIGNSLRFDGINDYVSLPIGSLINSLTNSTIATWVYWRGGTADYHRIWDFGNNTTVYMYLIADAGDTGKPRFSITINGSSNDDDTDSSVALAPNGWHHIAVTIDQANHTYKLYLDATLRGTKTSARYTPHSLGTTTNNWLGRSEYTGDPYLNGSLDDVRIYNRALSQTEVTALYQWSGSNGTVSGGAGYVKQSAIGSSGTSNFSLTASNAARMLTIAIAPNSSTSGENEIRP